MSIINKGALMVGSSVVVIGLAICATGAMAQDNTKDATNTSGDTQIVVVTGVSRKANKLDTSISVSTEDYQTIQSLAPRGTAEVFRALPGIRTESSSGGGNSNIGVRGIPVSTGGAKWVQVQEDGLPIMLMGDFDFAPADGFYKVDATLDHVESVRGGSASTFTTSGPGAIINMISKTGKKDGGTFSAETGLGYRDFRIDGDFGGHLTDDTYFNIGGHFQSGTDARHLGYNGTEGGQIKASLTKEFGDQGFIRVWAKVLDKKEAISFPQATPIVNGVFQKDGVSGLSPHDTLASPYIAHFISIDNGQVLHRDLSDGFHTISKSFGGQASFDVGNGFHFDDKFKYASIGGDFAGPFTNNVDTADHFLSTGSFMGSSFAGHAATIFNGPNAGAAVTSANLTALTGNPYLSDVAMFDVHFNDMGNFANDMKLSRAFDVSGSSLDVTVGFFHMTQNFKQSWHWQDLVTTTQNDAALVSIAGFTQNGQLGYNDGFNWSGTNRQTDLVFTADAPYADFTWKAGGLSLNASVRHDNMRENGNITAAAGRPVDVNGDGIISFAEQNVSVNQGLGAIDYFNFNVGHTSYSLGANYKLSDELAVFTRYSDGAAFNGERQYGSGAYDPTSGKLLLEDSFVDVVKQFEAGAKWQTKSFLPGRLDLNGTYFHADTEESQTDLTGSPPKPYAIAYRSYGVELEGIWSVGGFRFDGTTTWTHARVTKYGPNPAYVGNKPQRQADLIWNLNASYTVGAFDLGANVNGTSKSYAYIRNDLIMPGYTTVGAYINWHLSDKLTASINGNNIFDAVGFTEGENDGRMFQTGGSPAVNMTEARSIAGRTVSARLKYDF